MTQPTPRRGGLLTARLGPLPVWVWFIIFVLAVYLFLKWRQKNGSSANSSTTSSTSLTGQPGVLSSFPTDVFVNVTKNQGSSPGQAPTPGGQPAPNQSSGGGLNNVPSSPPARQTSVTYSAPAASQLSQVAAKTGVAPGVVAAANAGQLGAQAALSSFLGQPTIKNATPSQPVPVSPHQAHLAHLAHEQHVASVANSTAKIVTSLKAAGKLPTPSKSSSGTATTAAYNQGKTV